MSLLVAKETEWTIQCLTGSMRILCIMTFFESIDLEIMSSAFHKIGIVLSNLMF